MSHSLAIESVAEDTVLLRVLSFFIVGFAWGRCTENKDYQQTK